MGVFVVTFLVAGCSDDPPSDGTGGNGTGGTAAAGGSGGGSGGTAAMGGSASGTGGTPQGGSSSATGGTSSSSLFTMAPDCDVNVERLEGTFLGGAVMVNQTLFSSVLSDRFYYTVSTESRIRLQWGNVLAPNVAQPLTEGGYVRTFWDAANPSLLYCIVAGEIGGVAVSNSGEQYFKYSITRVRSGEVGMTQYAMPAVCDGAESDVSLWGCVHRSL